MGKRPIIVISNMFKKYVWSYLCSIVPYLHELKEYEIAKKKYNLILKKGSAVPDMMCTDVGLAGSEKA